MYDEVNGMLIKLIGGSFRGYPLVLVATIVIIFSASGVEVASLPNTPGCTHAVIWTSFFYYIWCTLDPVLSLLLYLSHICLLFVIMAYHVLRVRS